MPITKYTFTPGAPGLEPGIYVTCLKSERDMSKRWWDGKLWWDISSSRGAKALPFTWPTGRAARGIKMPAWYKTYGLVDTLYLRKISDQTKVRWGTAYKHFSPEETLDHLAKTGVIPKDWREAYQGEMRAALEKKGSTP